MFLKSASRKSIQVLLFLRRVFDREYEYDPSKVKEVLCNFEKLNMNFKLNFYVSLV